MKRENMTMIGPQEFEDCANEIRVHISGGKTLKEAVRQVWEEKKRGKVFLINAVRIISNLDNRAATKFVVEVTN